MRRASPHDLWWVPLKADLKSIVWYRDGPAPARRPAPLASWCIGMGDDGASGWPGSDWIEDLILQRAGPVLYARWATGDLDWTDDRVVAAWTTWAGMLAQDPDRAGDMLLADHRGPAGGPGLLFGGGCDLEHQGSFARAFYGADKDRAAFVDSARLLPGGPYTVKAHEVSADFAALFGRSGPAREMIRRLASRDAQEEWGRTGGVFSANAAVPPKTGTVDQQVVGASRTSGCRSAWTRRTSCRRRFGTRSTRPCCSRWRTPRNRYGRGWRTSRRSRTPSPRTPSRLTGVCGRPQ